MNIWKSYNAWQARRMDAKAKNSTGGVAWKWNYYAEQIRKRQPSLAHHIRYILAQRAERRAARQLAKAQANHAAARMLAKLRGLMRHPNLR